ncbi:MAG TPA: phosphate acyltransferase PlsX [Rhabdochlamydiaceae bacterium]|nr:phosphate acyltransferase PlsX [Rhabdochlamydiaceae bacterium]
MATAPRIGIDLLGSDTPPEKLFHAVIECFSKIELPAKFVVFGTKNLFLHIKAPPEITCIPVSEFISMEDSPLVAVRRKKNSSLCVGIEMLKKVELDAFITAGNTGALLACCKLELPMLPGIDRPALMTLIPTKKEPIAVLDVGANVSVKAEHLVQFASMGIAYQKTRGIERPTVGLLNIGSEKKKGTPEIRKAYEHLQQQLNRTTPLSSPIFIGNVEGRDVFHGEIDVLITDGFSGNIFLKTAEGLAEFILDDLQKAGAFEGSLELKNIISTLWNRLRYDEYPGAILCGVEGIVMKCHGRPSASSLVNSIKCAIRLSQHFFLEKIKQELRPTN